MIPPAPTDLWERVIARIAQLVFEREVVLQASGVGVQRLVTPIEQQRRPGPMPPPAPPEAAE